MPDNLAQVALQWVKGKLGDFGITAADLPQNATPEAIGGFILKVMGLTWDDLLAKATTAVGPDNVALLGEAYEFIKQYVEREGDTQAGFLTDLKNLASGNLINGWDSKALDILNDPAALKDMALAAIRDGVLNNAPALLRNALISIFPVSGGLKALYTSLKWIYDNTINGGENAPFRKFGGVVQAIAQNAQNSGPPKFQYQRPPETR